MSLIATSLSVDEAYDVFELLVVDLEETEDRRWVDEID